MPSARLAVEGFVEGGTDLGATPLCLPLAPDIPGQSTTTTYTDTSAARLAPLFYRVGVGL